MKSIFDFDCRDAIRRIVRKILKDDYGIKIPKEKSSKIQQDDPSSDGVFGVGLEKLPTVNIGDDCYCPIPKFLVEAVNFLKPHLKTEGLFRKSGSLARQRTIREQVQNGGSCALDISQSHDIANLMKQFLRELPEALLTSQLHGSFIKCLNLNTLNEQITSVLLVSLLIPDANLRVLQFLCEFISNVASHSQESKMTLNNLAIILSPNVMFTSKDRDCDKYHKEQTRVVDILFRSSNLIGIVSDEIIDKVNAIENEANSMSTSSADELDWAACEKQHRLRRRSRSISGFVSGIGRKIKGSNTGQLCTSGAAEDPRGDTPRVRRHRRTKSDKAIKVDQIMASGPTAALDIRTTVYSGSPDMAFMSSPNPRPGMRALKRKAGVHRATNRTSGQKSPRLTGRAGSCQSISNPKLISMPNQLFLGNRATLMPIMRSCEDVTGAVEEDEPVLLDSDALGDDQLSPSGIHNLEMDNMFPDADKENGKRSRKYSVMRQKQLEKFLREAKTPIQSRKPPVIKEQLFQTPLEGKRSTVEGVSSVASCPTPRVHKRDAVNNWQRLINMEQDKTPSHQ
eukprot:gene17573-19325_t